MGFSASHFSLYPVHRRTGARRFQERIPVHEGDIYEVINGIPLFILDGIVYSIIRNTIGEYEGHLHIDIGGGW